MSENYKSDAIESSAPGPHHINDILRRFEKFSKPVLPSLKSVNHLVVSASCDDQPEYSVQGNVYHDNDNSEAREVDKHVDGRNDFKTTPVPSKRSNKLKPTPRVRELIKDSNQGPKITKDKLIVLEEKVLIEEQSDSSSKIHETDNDLSQEFGAIQIKSRNIQPMTPNISNKYHSPSETTSELNLSSEVEKLLENGPPVKAPRAFIKKQVDRQIYSNDSLTSTVDAHATTASSLNIPLSHAEETINRKDKREDVSTITQANEYPNKSTAKVENTSTMLLTSETPQKILSINNTPIYENIAQKDSNAPSLPPRFTKTNPPNSNAIEKLNELKTMFQLPSFIISVKFNKRILFIIDIMIEATQESSSDVEENVVGNECNAWHSSMKDFVRRKTQEYVIDNQFEDDIQNLPYYKLIKKIVPAFIRNYYMDTDYTDSRHKSDEDDYEKVGTAIKTESIDQKVGNNDPLIKISIILNEIKLSESYHIDDLKSSIIEYSQQVSVSAVVRLLKSLLAMHCEFRTQLVKNDDLFWILRTFLDFDYMFELYAVFFRNKTKNLNDESTVQPKGGIHTYLYNDISDLLTNRLTKYQICVRNLIKLTMEGEVRDAAIKVMDMLKKTIGKYEVIATTSIVTNSSQRSRSPSINCEDETTKYLSKLVPGSHDWTDYGLFLLRNTFKIDDQKNDFVVFLFKKMFIVTQEISKEDFVYKYGLKLNELVLLPQDENKKTIKLKNYFKSKASKIDVVIKLEAKSEEIEKTWRMEINKCLWKQLKNKKNEV